MKYWSALQYFSTIVSYDFQTIFYFLGAKAPLGLASVTGQWSGVNPKKFQFVITCIFSC